MKPAEAQVSLQMGKPYYLDLSKQRLNVPDRNVYVEQVVDGRLGQPTIGIVHRGLQNQQVPMLFQQGLVPELTAFLQQKLPQRTNNHSVALCVRQLRVNETLSGFSELASADLAADVYLHLSDGYHFVHSVAAHVDDRALETTLLHAPHVALLLQNCLLQLTNANWELPLRRPARTLAQLATDRPPTPSRPAVLRAAAPRRGAYYSFEQFLTNRPDTTARVRPDTLRSNTLGWEGTLVLHARVRTADGARVPTRKIWGFSDGRQAYVRQRNTYRPLTRQGDFYTFVGSAPLDIAAANQRAWGYGVRRGGAAGAPITGYPFDGPEDNTGQPMVFSLDTRTGQVAPYPPLGQPQQADTAFVYVYRPIGSAPGAQRLLLNDREVGRLQPGQYLELAWPHFGQAMRLSIESASGPTLLMVPNASTANYVKVRSCSGYTPWQWMPVRQGEAEVDALEKQQ
ncbi:hypothetical protein [Hymenobacter terrenus]|uniref:hypothetical protein n=1 Tax=Hymenobacter terrenus TaxID=1629124 RepID=UPI0006196BCB|nr:hypothetical protein [Hymenobacter terrenus]